MYIILDETELLTPSEIRDKYNDKWIFLTNCEINWDKKLIRGVPRIIADKIYEGAEDGIYEVYKNSIIYGEIMELTYFIIDFHFPSIFLRPDDTWKTNNNTSD